MDVKAQFPHEQSAEGAFVRQHDAFRHWVTVDGREWIVDQPDPGAATPYDGAVQIAIRPERIHVIAEA